MASSGGIQIDPQYLPSFSDTADKKHGPIAGGLGAGFHQLLGLGGSAVQGIGSLTGLQSVADAGKGFAAHQAEIADRVGRPDLDIAPWQNGGASALPWAEYQLAKLVPTLVGYGAATAAAPEAVIPAGLARLGAVLPTALEGAGLRAGASFAARRAALETGTQLGKFIVGGGAFGGLTGFGQAIQSADQQPGGVTAMDAVQAAALSPAYAAAGLITPGFLKGALKGAEGNILSRVASNALKGSAVGAVQSGVMTGLDQTFRPDLSAQQKMANIVEGTVAGAAVAGLAGGALGIRGLKHVDPNELTTDALDQATSHVDQSQQQPQQPLLTSTVYADSAGRAAQDAQDLTNGAGLLDYNTIANPKQGSVRWARPYDQGLGEVPGTTEGPERGPSQQGPVRPFAEVETPGLIQIATTAKNYLENLPEDHKFTERDAKVRTQLQLMTEELGARGHDLESSADVTVPAVGAVEPGAADQKAAGGTKVAPVSTNSWETERRDLLKGVASRIRGQYADAASVDDLTARTKARLADKPSKSDLMLAERLGIKPNEHTGPVEAEGTRAEGQTREEAAVEATPEFKTRWDTLTKNTRDRTIKQLKPTDEQDALRKVYTALAGPDRQEVSARVHKLGRDIGLIDEDGQLTPLGESVSRETIPTEEAVGAAIDRGFKGSAASAFERGARSTDDTGHKFDSFEDLAAFKAGHEWAKPKGLGDRATRKAVRELGLGSHFEGGREVPQEQQRQRWLNQAIDQKYDPLVHPEENAQLKQLVREGDDGRALDEAERYLKSGQGALINAPAPVRPRDQTVRDTIFGPTKLPEPPIRALSPDSRQQFREQQAAEQLGKGQLLQDNQAAIRKHEHDELVRTELRKSLQLALDSHDVDPGRYMHLRQALDRGDNGRVRDALSNLGSLPHIHKNGRDITTGRDWVAAADLLHRQLDTGGGARTLMSHLKHLGGEIGNVAARFEKYVPDDVTVDILTPDEVADRFYSQEGYSLPQGTTITGEYEPNTRKIYLNAAMKHPATALHEIMHAITADHINNKTPIGREMTAMFERFKKSGPATDYAFTNTHEFMAEFLSRQQVRDYVKNAQPTIFQRAWNVIRKMLGMPSKDYVERIFKLAELAGEAPASRLERGSPEVFHKLVRDRMEDVVGLADRLVQRDGAAGVVRKTTLGWATIHDIAQHWGKAWFGASEENPVMAYEKHLNQKQSIVARMAQMMTTARDEVQHLIRTAKESGETLVRLMTMSEFGIDPTRAWDKQAARVRDRPELQKVHAEAHKLYNDHLVRPNGGAGAKAYQNLRNVNDVMMFSQLAVSLHAQVSADAWAGKELARFAVDPMDRFMAAQEKEDFTPQLARKWWADELDAQMGAVGDYLKKHRDFASTLDVENLKEARQRAEIEHRTEPLTQRVKNIRTTIGQIEEAPYFHLGRFGNYFVGWHVTDQAALGKVADALANENGGKGFGVVISKDSDKVNAFVRVENQRQEADLHKAILELEKQGLIEPNTLVSGERSSDVVRNSFADQWFERMVSDIEANEEIDSKAKKAAVEALRDLHLDMMPENSISRVMTHREGVPGYDADMLRSFEHRANVGINALAGMVISPKVTRAFTDMRNLEKAAQHEQSLDVAPIAQRNGMTNVIDELSRRERERPQWPQTKLLDQLRAVNHAWFLGGSISYGAVNLTQLGATLLPELGAKHGFVKAARAIGSVTPDAIRIIRQVAAEGRKVSLSRAMDAVVTRGVLDKAGLKGDLAEFIMRVANTGQLDIGGPSRELMRAAEGRGSDKVDTVLRYASSIGYYSETLSRLVAALAVRELNPKMSVEKAAEHASYVLKETMWDYSQANQGREFGKMGVFGKVTPLATAFMQYTAQLTGKLYRETYEAIKGNTPAERAEARRFLAYHLTGMTVLAGSLGLPMVSALAATVDRLKDLFDGDDQPSNVRAAWRNLLADAFGKDVGEVLSRGATRAVGIDISQRVGEQDILPFSRMIADRRNFKDSIKDMQSRSWGAPSSMIANTLQGGEQIANGDFLGGMVKMLPNALAAPIKAYQMTDKGFVDAAGHELPMTPGAKDIAVQLFGFNPAAKAEYSEARGDQQVRKGQLTRQATVLRDRLVQSVLDKDQATARDTLEQIKTFNQANPTLGISGTDIEGMLRRRAKAAALAKTTSSPLGTDPADRNGQRLTAYANY